MPLVYMDFQGGSRYRRGLVYRVSDTVASQLCDEPGPENCTGGVPFASRIEPSMVRPIEAFAESMGLKFPVMAPPELLPGTAESVTVEAPDAEDLGSLTVAELKSRLSERGLSASGKKADLLERLQGAEG